MSTVDHDDHTFGQHRHRPGEQRTRIVIAITALTMAVEIAAGLAYGSMALLADGLHMASHTVALGIAAYAYVYARRHAGDRRFSFGTGKVNALGGYTGAVLLAVFAAFMAIESARRFFEPVTIQFDQAVLVAILGLGVNAVSALILGAGHDHGEHDHHHHDHNLRSAYLHVLADAVTSLAAIVALLAGKYLGAGWMDPAMGIVGSLLVARWSWSLLKLSGHVLLDRQAPPEVLEEIRKAVESDDDAEVTDLHVWSIGPGIRAAEIRLRAAAPATPEAYRRRVASCPGLVHVVVEVGKKAQRVQPKEDEAREEEAGQT